MKYPVLPVMQCDPNCGECCGPATCTEGEFQAVANFAAERGLTPIKQVSYPLIHDSMSFWLW